MDIICKKCIIYCDNKMIIGEVMEDLDNKIIVQGFEVSDIGNNMVYAPDVPSFKTQQTQHINNFITSDPDRLFRFYTKKITDDDRIQFLETVLEFRRGNMDVFEVALADINKIEFHFKGR